MSFARPTPTIEDYLGIIFIFDRDKQRVKGANIAEILKVSPPTVNATLKRMMRDGWILPAPEKGYRFTSDGKLAAESLMRRHMLTEWLLSNSLSVPWSRSHLEAHRIEHALSSQVEARLIEQLKDKPTCPHGNPLPGYEDTVVNWRPIGEFSEGSSLFIRRIHEFGEEDPELLKFLEVNGVLPGVKVRLLEILPFNQTLTLQVSDQRVTLGETITRYLYAEEA